MKKISGFKYIVCIAICLIFQQPVWSTSGEVQELTGIPMHWRSNNKSDDQLSLAIEDLYVALYNTGNLPVKKFADQKGRPVESILRSEGLFYGNFFPEGVEAVICDLNYKYCRRPLKKSAHGELKRIVNHVGGYRKSRGTWANHSGTTLILPDLVFKSYTMLASVPYQDTADMEKIAKTQKADCSQWQAPCEDVVRSLNRVHFDSKRKQTKWPNTIILPVTGVETELTLTGTKGSRAIKILEDLGRPSQRSVSLPINRNKRFSSRWKAFMRNGAPADLAINALSRYILSTGRTALRSHSFADKFFPNQQTLFSLINHPFLNLEQIPAKFQQQIPILVLDTWIDQNHCEFKDNIELLSVPENANSNRTKSNECGSIMTMSPNLADDHGTHVTGLIASAPNTSGVVGLNPYAQVKYITVDMVQLMASSYRDQLANTVLTEALGKSLKAANISWAYSNQVGHGDPISRNIEMLRQSTLFVAAAGNAAESRDSVCSEMPACLSDLENVITVIGLNRDQDKPEIWREDSRGSNWSQKFHIGAIAEKVLSTTYHDYIGHFSGTSQAAPQVTAAASLIYSVYESHHKIDTPELLPIRVKNRLIYTSDLFNELLDKVKGGRLNVDRALDVAQDYVHIEKNGDKETYQGTLVRFGNDQRNEYIECRRQNDKIVQIKRRDLKRMFYDKHRRKYIVFSNSESGNPESALERITDCRLTTRSHLASIETDDGTLVEFQFRDIKDYIPAMF